MNKLFLDIGNSFLKWSTFENGVYFYYGRVKLEDVINNGLELLNIDITPDHVYFCNVSDNEQVDQLKNLIQEYWKIIPTQLTSQKSCCDLNNGYQNYAQLGSDRWYAMIGASQISSKSTIVIDAGTALTVDVVIEGIHQGGFIVPGLRLLRSSLSQNTADLPDLSIEDNLNNTVNEPLGTQTQTAILGGTLYMTASFLNQLIHDLFKQYNKNFSVIITGGDAALLASVLDVKSEVVEDLVLHGMASAVKSIKNHK
jgi:type III pantothenate kinase